MHGRRFYNELAHSMYLTTQKLAPNTLKGLAIHIVNDNITLEKEIKISPTGFAFSQPVSNEIIS